MRKTLLFFLCSITLFCSEVFSQDYQQYQQYQQNELGWQEGNRIEAAIDSFVQQHKHRIGIFRFQPRIGVRGGFDSNAVFGNVEDKKENDFFVSAIPGISGGLKFGNRAYLQLSQDFNFLYYFRNQQRRDIFGTSLAEFVTGTPRLLTTLNGGYTRREEQVNQELDEPVEHKVINGDAIVEYSVSRKTDIQHSFYVENTTFIETAAQLATGLDLFDRRTYRLGTAIGYALKKTLRLKGDINLSRSETLDTNQVMNHIQLLTGLEMRRDRLTADFEAGVGRSTQENGTTRYNLEIDGRADYQLAHRILVGGFISRRLDFSFLSATATLVVTEGGGHFTAPLGRIFALNGTYTVGRNDFGESIIDGVVVDHDTFQHGELGLSIRTLKGVSIRPGIRYIRRDTAIPELSKSDFFWFIGLGFGYTFNL